MKKTASASTSQIDKSIVKEASRRPKIDRQASRKRNSQCLQESIAASQTSQGKWSGNELDAKSSTLRAVHEQPATRQSPSQQDSPKRKRLATLSTLEIPDSPSSADTQGGSQARCSPEPATPDSASTEHTLFTPMAGASKGLRKDDPRILRDILDALNYLEAFDDRGSRGNAGPNVGPLG